MSDQELFLFYVALAETAVSRKKLLKLKFYKAMTKLIKICYKYHYKTVTNKNKIFS